MDFHLIIDSGVLIYEAGAARSAACRSYSFSYVCKASEICFKEISATALWVYFLAYISQLEDKFFRTGREGANQKIFLEILLPIIC